MKKRVYCEKAVIYPGALGVAFMFKHGPYRYLRGIGKPFHYRNLIYRHFVGAQWGL